MHRRDETQRYKSLAFTTMAYAHTLTEAKFVSFFQQLFGAEKGVYDADYFREINEKGKPSRADTLVIDEKQDVNGSLFWDMESGQFSQTQRFRGDQHIDEMKLINFENLDGSTADRIDFNIFGTNDDNIITTSDGDDQINARGGYNIIQTGSGQDIITGGVGVDMVTGGADEDIFVTQVGRGLMFIEDFRQGEDVLRMVEGVTEGVDPVIKDYRDAWGDIRDHLMFNAGLDPWESEAVYFDAIDDFNAASVIYKDGDLVAVIDGVSADQLMISAEMNAII